MPSNCLQLHEAMQVHAHGAQTLALLAWKLLIYWQSLSAENSATAST